MYDPSIYHLTIVWCTRFLWTDFTLYCVTNLFYMCHPVLSLCMTRDGRLVSGSRDESIKIWDLKNDESRQTLKGHSKTGMFLPFYNDINLVIRLSVFDILWVFVWLLFSFQFCCTTVLETDIYIIIVLPNCFILVSQSMLFVWRPMVV